MATLANELSNVFKTGRQSLRVISELLPAFSILFEPYTIHASECRIWFSNAASWFPRRLKSKDQEYLSLKESLISQNLPADTSAVLRRLHPGGSLGVNLVGQDSVGFEDDLLAQILTTDAQLVGKEVPEEIEEQRPRVLVT
jgi:hypothetical protein